MQAFFKILCRTGQLSNAPEGHLSRIPGSPVAERRGNAPRMSGGHGGQACLEPVTIRSIRLLAGA